MLIQPYAVSRKDGNVITAASWRGTGTLLVFNTILEQIIEAKLQGVCMRDIDEDGDYDDYRKVVDLEWPTKKIDEYGKKKGWLAVCELLSPYHDDLIAEADGDKESLCEAYTINDEFYKCVIAAPRELQKRTVLTREEHEAR